MGQDKARLSLGGLTLAGRLASLLSDLFEEVLLIGGDPPGDAPGRRVSDPPGPSCALRGLVGALRAASAERVVVLATDLPLVTPDLLLALVAYPEADAVVPRPAEGPQPLCALYRREPVLAAAQARLESGELALRGVLDDVSVHFLEPESLAALDAAGQALWNLNTPEDLARARAWLGVERPTMRHG